MVPVEDDGSLPVMVLKSSGLTSPVVHRTSPVKVRLPLFLHFKIFQTGLLNDKLPEFLYRAIFIFINNAYQCRWYPAGIVAPVLSGVVFPLCIQVEINLIKLEASALSTLNRKT